MESYKEILPKIKAFIFDCDGVFTDSTVLLLPGGEQARTMSVRDGLAVQLAARKGFPVAIITGGRSTLVVDRFKGLGIDDVFLNVKDKTAVLNDYLAKIGLNADEVLYMGDDLPDLPVMKLVGLPCCPKNAAEEILGVSKYISPIDGGKGCVRDIVEQTLRVQNKWNWSDEQSR
ncbi:MAG: 3-deoxy-D-manno-octulosonate 8-phosphate phosphatase (KDO 8-P phosphatase) [Sphingobacteriales bacterium]|jgi:3-deoxy-D-manno-octulosonate 8-phosphate phosphatase (KDO 8-P phosphatase)